MKNFISCHVCLPFVQCVASMCQFETLEKVYWTLVYDVLWFPWSWEHREIGQDIFWDHPLLYPYGKGPLPLVMCMPALRCIYVSPPASLSIQERFTGHSDCNSEWHLCHRLVVSPPEQCKRGVASTVTFIRF